MWYWEVVNIDIKLIQKTFHVNCNNIGFLTSMVNSCDKMSAETGVGV